MNEWRPIAGYEREDEVSNTGEIRSIPRIVMCGHNKKQKKIISGKIKNQHVTDKGYLAVNLSKNSIEVVRSVHRLVALAFVSNPENKPQINHINGIKTDNRIENLEWCTNKENVIHAVSIGMGGGVRGERSPHHKLTEIQVREIRRKYIPRKYSTFTLGKEYGVDRTTIGEIVRNRGWRHVQ